MASTSTLPILIFSLTLLAAAAAATSTDDFIESKCNTTDYPSVCVQSLSPYANKIHKSPRQLAQVALIVSLAKARYAKAYVTHLSRSDELRPREFGSLKDCVEVIGDSVDRLSKSVHEFQAASQAQSSDFLWHMSNVQTWASAALTDENTCVDGFDGSGQNRRMQSAIKAQFEDVMQCTSNALALVNQFVDKYHPKNV